MCEGACPTQAIKLTVNQIATQREANGMQVQGEVVAKPCPKCQQKTPRPDLFADRIYNFELPISEEEEELTAFQREQQQAFLERGKLAVQTETACPECQQRVLVAEEKICN
jgi:endogenous inhibitor of DNA gyrase (YacG/DUF329 family)